MGGGGGGGAQAPPAPPYISAPGMSDMTSLVKCMGMSDMTHSLVKSNSITDHILVVLLLWP